MDPGDGIVHFFYSAASWENPILFLDLWNKPLFTILSSPFAQFGFGGMLVFNVLVFTLTILYGWKTLHRLNVNRYFALSFPLLLLLTQDYANTILGGNTEPLFSLLLVVALWFWIQEKYLFFALFIGLLLFSRSEGQLPVLLGFLLLVYIRQWKALFSLFLPFLFFASIGLAIFDDFLWYFNRSPYQMNNTIYGVGTYDHYLMSYKNFLGNHGLFLFLLALPATLLHLFRKRFTTQTGGLTLLTYGTFLGVIAAHSYFWGSGQNASIGLTRIATQALPSFLICQIYFLQKTPWKWPTLSNYFAIALAGILVVYLLFTPYFFKKVKPMELATKELFDRNKTQLQNQTLLTSHPYFAYLLGGNYMRPSSKVKLLNTSSYTPMRSDLNFVFWDSNFGPQESGVSLSSLKENKRLTIVDSVQIENSSTYLFQVIE